MAGTINRTPCPRCTTVGTLYINIEFIAKPIGTWSLSGAQVKASGWMKPVLRCRHNHCEFKLVGEFDGDNHAVFKPSREIT